MGEDGGVVRMRHWWWWGGAFAKREAGEGGWGQKPQTEPLGLDFGRAVGNGGGERWGEVVGRRIRGGDGVGAPGSRNVRLGKGVGAKNPKPRRWGSISGAPLETALESDGGRWWGGVYAVATASGRLVRETRGWRGFGPKTPKRAAVARFGAASGLQAEMGDGVGLQAPLPW